MSDNPRIFYDFEFHFAGGDPIVATAEDGRWSLQPSAKNGSALIFQVRHDSGLVDEWTINQGALLYLRTTKRDVPQPSSIEDSGRTRIVGGLAH